MESDADRSPIPSGDVVEDKNGTRGLLIVVALLTAYAVWRFPFWLAHSNRDQTEWFLPWLSHILRVGRFHALEASFSNYNPAFVYALIGSSFFTSFFSPITVVKLTNLPFLVLTATVMVVSCRSLGCTWQRSLAGAALVLIAPETMENAWSWGQCDVIYSSFLLCFIVAASFKRPALSMISFGIALSLKLQAIFLGPLVLMMLLTGELPAWTSLLVPLTYLAMLTPAMLAGRPPSNLIFIYGAQYKYFNSMAYSVANPYRVILRFAGEGSLAELIKKIGFVVSILCNAALLFYLWRRRDVLKSFVGAVVFGTISLMLEVYTLPKMHERYYFPADLLLLLLVAVHPRRFWLPAVLMQIVSVFSYRAYLYDKQEHVWQFMLAALAVALVFWLLVKEVERLQQSSFIPKESLP